MPPSRIIVSSGLMSYNVLARKYRPQTILRGYRTRARHTRTSAADASNRGAPPMVHFQRTIAGSEKPQLARHSGGHGLELPLVRQTGPPSLAASANPAPRFVRVMRSTSSRSTPPPIAGIDEIRETARSTTRYKARARPLQDLHSRRSSPDYRRCLQRFA